MLKRTGGPLKITLMWDIVQLRKGSFVILSIQVPCVLLVLLRTVVYVRVCIIDLSNQKEIINPSSSELF